jgi:DNA repair protein RadA/Sms
LSKEKTKFVCQECGYSSLKWLGRCPECSLFNTMAEEIVVKKEKNRLSGSLAAVDKLNVPVPITAIDSSTSLRLSTGVKEFDRVLGGGIVNGALILLGGDPGIGKSTLLLQVALCAAQVKRKTLYVTGEESAAQIKLRAERLGELNGNLLIFTETNIENIILKAAAEKPDLLIVDSIQTMYSNDTPSSAGSVGQVRLCTASLMRFAKETSIPTVIVGHVTKEGSIAGPKLLEHMVDVVLYFEGERSYSFRVLRAIKNRFGTTNESGIFSMEDNGLIEVTNPSAVLLSQRPNGAPGSVVMAYMEGFRPILIEVQALVSTTCFGMPRRMAAGFDYNRLIMLMAVLEKRVGLLLGNQDAYINAVGGFKITERASDLAVSLAIVSSFNGRAFDEKTVAMGEVGLTGELRLLSRAEERIREAASLGFRRFIIPHGNLANLKVNSPQLKIIGAASVREAIDAAQL